MKLVSLLLSVTVVPVSVFARHGDVDTDLASAGYRPGVAVMLEDTARPAVRSHVGSTASFVATRQITVDLAAAGYGPAGAIRFPAIDHVAPLGLLRTRVDYRTSDALRADLLSAGYVPLPVSSRVLIASPER